MGESVVVGSVGSAGGAHGNEQVVGERRLSLCVWVSLEPTPCCVDRCVRGPPSRLVSSAKARYLVLKNSLIYPPLFFVIFGLEKLSPSEEIHVLLAPVHGQE